MRAILVKVKSDYRRLEQQTGAAPAELMALVDSAYNGGFGGVLQDRQLCALKPGCDPNRWFGHVEFTSTKSREKWRGYGKSAYAINREHTELVLNVRRAKYVPGLGPDLLSALSRRTIRTS